MKYEYLLINYKLTISNFYLFSGKIIYKVNYTVGKKLNNLVFPIKVNSINLDATAPIGFSLSSTKTKDDSNGVSVPIAATSGYALFKSTIGGNLGMIVKVTLSGFINNNKYQVLVDYSYGDIDDL